MHAAMIPAHEGSADQIQSSLLPPVQVDLPESESDGLVQSHPDAGKQEQLVSWRITLLCPGIL